MEGIDAGRLAQLACQVGAMAEAWGAEAEFLREPMYCFRLTKTKRGSDNKVHRMDHYLSPRGLDQYKGNPEYLIENTLRYMDEELNQF